MANTYGGGIKRYVSFLFIALTPSSNTFPFMKPCRSMPCRKRKVIRKNAHSAKRYAGNDPVESPSCSKQTSSLEYPRNESREIGAKRDEDLKQKNPSTSRTVDRESSENELEASVDFPSKIYHTDFLSNSSCLDIDQLLFSHNPIEQSHEKGEGNNNAVNTVRDATDLIYGGAGTNSFIATSGRPVDERNFGDELLEGVYPEDFSFSLDLSLCTTSLDPGIVIENNEVTVPSTKDGKDSSVFDRPEPESAVTQQILSNVPVPPPMVSPVRIPSSPPLVPSDDFQFSQPPSPWSSSQRASTPFNPHQTPLGIDVAREQGDYPVNTFYGLPLIVPALLEQHRGIKRLYG